MPTFPERATERPGITRADGTLSVAITGHRNLGNQAPFVTRACHAVLATLRARHTGTMLALSGLAVGADTIFAEAALALDLPLHAVLAADDVIEDYPQPADRRRFLELCGRSHTVHQLPFASRCDAAYLALGMFLVDRCDLLVAAWNGLPAAGVGGTGDVVAYAQACTRPFVHLNTRTGRIAWPAAGEW